MKRVAIPLCLAAGIASAGAVAQGANDPMAQLRACSLLEHAERLACMDRLLRDIAPPAAPAPGLAQAPAATPPSVTAADAWIVSETTSPVDYMPIVVATASARSGAEGTALQLAIHCRGGRTDLVVGGPGVGRGGEDAALSYRVNDGPAVQLATGPAATGTGVAVRGDVVRLLASLPDQGDIALRVATRQGAVHEARFALSALKAVRDRLAAACKWPGAIGAPRN